MIATATRGDDEPDPADERCEDDPIFEDMPFDFFIRPQLSV
jgi:hypothetical protein